MTVRHRKNDVLDGAVENGYHCARNRRDARALKQGFRKPSLSRTSAERTALQNSSRSRFRVEIMDFMIVRHRENDVLDDAVEIKKYCTENRRVVKTLKQGLENHFSAGQVPREPLCKILLAAVFVLKSWIM